MQTTLQDNLPRRMRYYQSMIDSDSLMKGEDYSSLKESFVIFLCTEDPLKLGIPVYTFKSLCLENKDFILDDGTTKILFNAKAADSEKDVEIKTFLDYLLNGKSCDTFTKNIDSLVAKLKDNEKFRSEYMAGALWFRDAKKQGFDEGFAQGALLVRDAKKQGFDEGISQGFSQGIAQQKAEDEKRLAQKDAEVARLAAEIAELKAQLEAIKK